MATILMMSAKVIICVHDVTNKFLSRDSSHIVDVEMWSCDQNLVNLAKFGKSRRKTAFSEGWSWFKFNNWGLTLRENLKFYTSVSKGLSLKVRKFFGPNSYVCRSCRGKIGRGDLPPILNRVKCSIV